VRFDPGSQVPRRPDYGRGVYRRLIDLRSREGSVEAWLEDDFHHLGLVLHHDGERVVSIEGEALRIPWTTCPGAVGALGQLAGLRLTRSHRDVAAHADPRLQCTHLFDLACTAIAAGAAGVERRRYTLCVPDRGAKGGPVRVSVERDGAPILVWTLDGMAIASPDPFAGRALVGGGFADWCDRTLEPDVAEAAQLLRRAVLIAMGRAFHMDAVARASDIPGGTCHTYREGVMEQGLRIVGTTRDFSERPGALLEDL